MSGSAVLLEAHDLARRHPVGDGWLLDQVSLSLHAGDRLAIVGATGSGKTLLLRALALFDPLDAGRVTFQGQPIAATRVPQYRSQVMYLHQRAVLVEGSVEKNLRLPYGLQTHSGRRFERSVAVEMLRRLGRDEAFLGRSQRDLSGGEGQMVAFVRALQLEPDVLLLDEPTASLDADTAGAIESLVSDWFDAAPHARALVWVSHDALQARRVSNRLMTMRSAQLRAERPMNDYIQLSAWQVALAAALILINSLVSIALRLRLERQLLLASVRMVVQLLLMGFVLQAVFAWRNAQSLLAVMLVMTLVAGFTAVRRNERPYPGIYLHSIVSVWASSWIITAFAVTAVLQQADPWRQPQYTIPLLGMILGNTLNGISLGLGRLTDQLVTRRDQVELVLALGGTRWEAARGAVRDAVRTGMIPMINSMMVTGIVSLPGMMTGQLLAGVDPLDAVKYQIVIMFLIASGTALGTVGVVLLGYFRLFNARHQFEYRLIQNKRDA